MTALRACLAAAVVVTGSAAPAAADAPVQRETSAWTVTQDESVCGGAVVPVTFDGTMTMRSVRSGSWLRVHTDLSWYQDGVRFTGRATGGFSEPPSGRTTTYRIHGSAVGDDGVKVHIAEVVHAVRSNGALQVRVEFERVRCH